MDPAKVKDILEWPVPRSVKDIRGFLGITGCYRVFIKNYSLVATPLKNILKKESKITWLPEHQASFNSLPICHKLEWSCDLYLGLVV